MAFLLSLAAPGGAEEVQYLTPTNVEMEVRKYEGRVHEPYLYPVDAGLRYGGVFRTNFDLVRYNRYTLFMNNMIHFDQSEVDGKIKYAGWNFEIGSAILFDKQGNTKLDIGRGHWSQHCLECLRDTHFPVRDWYFIRFKIFP